MMKRFFLALAVTGLVAGAALAGVAVSAPAAAACTYHGS
jgi:hypothetical protein